MKFRTRRQGGSLYRQPPVKHPQCKLVHDPGSWTDGDLCVLEIDLTSMEELVALMKQEPEWIQECGFVVRVLPEWPERLEIVIADDYLS
jgi:hypothetical protein